jgi:hypothetical protein
MQFTFPRSIAFCEDFLFVAFKALRSEAFNFTGLLSVFLVSSVWLVVSWMSNSMSSLSSYSSWSSIFLLLFFFSWTGVSSIYWILSAWLKFISRLARFTSKAFLFNESSMNI